MDASTIEMNAELEERYWWFLGRRRVIKEMLKAWFPGGNLSLLDWGCGTGGNFSMLAKFGEVVGVDVSEQSLEVCRKRGFAGVHHIKDIDAFEPSRDFDVVTLLDVVEHVKDDGAFLKKFHRFLKPDGYILITVPAYQFIWSEHDEMLHHYRRYTRPQITARLEEAGYEIAKASYFISFLVLPIIIYRYMRRLFGIRRTSGYAYVEFPPAVNNFFRRLITLEAYLMNYINIPFGLSILVLARPRSRTAEPSQTHHV